MREDQQPGAGSAIAGFVAALGVMLLGRFASRSASTQHGSMLAEAAPAAARRIGWREKARIAGVVILAEIILAPVLAGLFIWSGLYNVGATSPHLALTHTILHRAMIQSARRHSEDLPAPPLDDARLIRRGAAHFETGCAPCHGSPLTPPSPIEIGATPPPPPLYSAVLDFTPHQLHWIVKHGVKMTAMPPWPEQRRNDEVWAMVAFLKALPRVRREDYAELIGASQQQQKSGDAGLQALSDSGDAQQHGCAACHGADGRGRDGVAPQIAGLSAAYIGAQLEAFRSGERASGIMRPVAMGLSSEKAAALAEQFAGMPRRRTGSEAPADLLARGENVAKVGIGSAAPCESCHSAEKGPRDPRIPSLEGQDRDYLANQLRLFAEGVRNGPNASSMRLIARSLSPEDAAAVAAYYATRQDASGAGVAAR